MFHNFMFFLIILKYIWNFKLYFLSSILPPLIIEYNNRTTWLAQNCYTKIKYQN